jgi:hypothetical protein
MKITNLLLAAALAFAVPSVAFAGDIAPETKKVCHKDDKTGKDVCKTIKVHKKADKVTTGDPTAPEAKKKK